jgi:hypothetical protein
MDPRGSGPISVQSISFSISVHNAEALGMDPGGSGL